MKKSDIIIGSKYNKLTILEIVQDGKGVFLCECGNSKTISLFNVVNGHTKTCGCEQSSSRIKHDAGSKFGMLTVLKRHSNGIVSVICECGTIKEVSLNAIAFGKTKSCGCLNRSRITKHGLCQHPLYGVWEGIVGRCHNPNSDIYHHYGGRGVIMCSEWRNDFAAFYKWALDNGWRKGLVIDKDKKCPEGITPVYGPEHCSVITQRENLRNTSINRIVTHNGQSMCLKEWSEKLKINYRALRARIDRGWPLERAFVNENFVHNQKKRFAEWPHN